MKMLGSYINGNHKVIIFDDGTKISSTINSKDELFTSFDRGMELYSYIKGYFRSLKWRAE